MGWTACVDLPAFPLQLLLREHPEWAGWPVAVVAADRPEAPILAVNAAARRARVTPGLRFAAAVGLCRELRAGVVAAPVVERARGEILALLRRFSPGVEPHPEEPGVFWLEAEGLERLFGDRRAWAIRLREELLRAGFRAGVVVGFRKALTLALARAGEGVRVLSHPEEEAAAIRRLPLEAFPFPPSSRETLERLGLRTLGDFLALPARGVARRFGAAAARWHRELRGEVVPPLHPLPPPSEDREGFHFVRGEGRTDRLGRVLRPLLERLLGKLRQRGEKLDRLRLLLRLADGTRRLELLRPAAPTDDPRTAAELLRLRLEGLRLSRPVVEATLWAEGTRTVPAERSLFAARPPRDLGAAEEALARIAARCGNDAVLQAELREGHLPEASFRWVPRRTLKLPAPRRVVVPRLVRTIEERPLPLPQRLRVEPDGWLAGRLAEGPVVRTYGPYVLSGGWWVRRIRREYHYAELRRGEILWLYLDRRRERWFLQGRVR